MRIWGIDFVTTPSPRNPLVVVGGELNNGVLRLDSLERFGHNALPAVLDREGPWVLGLDVPFGLPAEFVSSESLRPGWHSYADVISRMTWPDLQSRLGSFRAQRSKGQREPKRECDRLAGALSPLKVANPPMARMFQAAAATLLGADCDILPMRMTGRDRVVVEVYPKLIAKRLAPGATYKSARSAKRDHSNVRESIISALRAQALAGDFGFLVECSDELAQASIEDESGETIDSLYAAVSAAWAFGRCGTDWGVPADASRESGWIVDPRLVEPRALQSPSQFAPIKELHQLLGAKELRLAVAESVTCGHVQALVGSESGASKQFVGGMTVYNLDQKVKQLAVDRGHAKSLDCVSERVAAEMADGVAKVMCAQVGLSTTGYAEPTGDERAREPFAWCAISIDGSSVAYRIDAGTRGRTAAQKYIAERAVDHLLERLRGLG